MTPEIATLLLIVFFLYALSIINAAWYLWNWHFFTRQDARTKIRQWAHQVDAERETRYPEKSGFTGFWGDDTDWEQYELSTPSFVIPDQCARTMVSAPRRLKGVVVSNHPLQQCPW